jgi:AcrR family transcriptional regulator
MEIDPTAAPGHKAGRPRRGTEGERMDAIMNAATRVFLREGFGLASIDRVAGEAGVSTRTIYERFKNKADLLEAVIKRLVDRDLAKMFAGDDFEDLEPEAALTRIGHTICERMGDPESCALFRIVVCESTRFPELTAQVRARSKQRIAGALGGYLARQQQRGSVAVDDAPKAALLFMQMISATMEECILFGPPDAMAGVDVTRHVDRVVTLFLFGAVPRADRPSSQELSQ